MPEYISREAALDSLCTACESVPIDEKELCPYRFAGCQEYANLSTLRAADVKPVVHSRWLGDAEVEMRDGWVYRLHRCKNCNGMVVAGPYDFCPHCGADMRE